MARVALLAGVFLLAGVSKIVAGPMSGISAEPGGALDQILDSHLVRMCVATLEVGVAGLLLVRRTRAHALVVSLVLGLAFLGATTFSVVTGDGARSCGCLGAHELSTIPHLSLLVGIIVTSLSCMVDQGRRSSQEASSQA
jgi:hypothetical protein